MTTRTTDWTGTDLDPWPALTPSGVWTHVTDIATVGAPVTVIETNRGRARSAAATTIGAKRSHHADYAAFKFASVEVRVRVESSVVSGNVPVPYLGLHTPAASGTAANSDRYEARFGFDSDGKAGSHVVKIVGGTVTTLLSSTGAGGGLAGYYAFRAVKLAASVRLQFIFSASPITSWDAAKSVDDATSGLWDTIGGVCITEGYPVSDPTVQTTIWYDDFSTTDILPCLPSGIGSTAALGVPTRTLRITRAVTGIGSTVALGTPTRTLSITRSVTGLGSTVALGTPTRTLSITRAVTGRATTVAFGVPSASIPVASQTRSVTGRASTLAVGTLTLYVLTADTNPFAIKFTDQGIIELADAGVIKFREPAALAVR